MERTTVGLTELGTQGDNAERIGRPFEARSRANVDATRPTSFEDAAEQIENMRDAIGRRQLLEQYAEAVRRIPGHAVAGFRADPDTVANAYKALDLARRGLSGAGAWRTRELHLYKAVSDLN